MMGKCIINKYPYATYVGVLGKIIIKGISWSDDTKLRAVSLRQLSFLSGGDAIVVFLIFYTVIGE